MIIQDNESIELRAFRRDVLMIRWLAVTLWDAGSRPVRVVEDPAACLARPSEVRGKQPCRRLSRLPRGLHLLLMLCMFSLDAMHVFRPRELSIFILEPRATPRCQP